MTKILITGGTGMVGNNLKKSFADNNLQGLFVGRGKDNQYNLLDYNKTQQLFSDTNPDIVVFAAANVGGLEYNKNNPGYLIRDNLRMGLNILDACVEFNVSQLYITSTCCSYPKYCQVPFKEDDLWKDKEEETNRAYGIAKKTIIAASQYYRQQFGLKSTCFIMANLYGKHDNFNPNSSHVVPALIKKFVEAKENNLPEVKCFGTGNATRDLLNAQDCAQAIAHTILSQFDYPEPINLGTGKDISIYDLAHLIAKLVGYTDGKIVFSGEVGDGQPKRLLDVSRAKQLLNWEAAISLEDGLKETIEWYRQNRPTT
jgi:GDP-L-fucose synthase